MNRIVEPRPRGRRRRSPAAPNATVSVLRWPSGGASGGVFEMFSAREPGWFATLGPASLGAGGENLLFVSASTRVAPYAPGVLLSLVNTSPSQAVRLAIKLAGRMPRSVVGTVMTAPPLDPRDAGSALAAVSDARPVAFRGAQLKGKVVEITVPARSVVVLTISQRTAAHRSRVM